MSNNKMATARKQSRTNDAHVEQPIDQLLTMDLSGRNN